MRRPADFYVDVSPGLLNGLIYFAVVLLGCGYIVFSKLYGLGALYVTSIPIVVMIGYALLLASARLLRLRDDQSGDNLYYMGFLFTLTILAMSLYQFSATGSAEQIVQNFGVAIASTICGIALRIFFNQMRRDPIEVEYSARLELAEASRKVKRELEGTALEFSYFRRATQQSIADALDEVNLMLKEAKDRLVSQLDDFAATSSRPLAEASKRSGESIEDLNYLISKSLGTAASEISDRAGELSGNIGSIAQSLDGVVARLAVMQTPDQGVEIKLTPMIEELSRAVSAFRVSAEAQSRAVDVSVEQTRTLSTAIAMLLAEIRSAEIRRTGSPSAGEARGVAKPRITARASDSTIQPSLWNDSDKGQESQDG